MRVLILIIGLGGATLAQTSSPTSDLPAAPDTTAHTLTKVPPEVPPNPTPWHYFLKTFSWEEWAADGASAALEQYRHVPEEWSLGARGYAKRYASAFGTSLTDHTLHLAFGELHHEHLGYVPSDLRGFKARAWYALRSSFVANDATTGAPKLAVGELMGAFGGGLVSRTWQPSSQRGISRGFIAGGENLGINAGLHVFREFFRRGVH